MNKRKYLRAMRYLTYLADLPGENIAPPCVERAHNWYAGKVSRRNSSR